MMMPDTSTSVATKGAEAVAGVEAEAPEHEGQHRAHHRPEQHYPDQADAHGERHQQRVLAVGVVNQACLVQALPQQNAGRADDAQQQAQRQPAAQLAAKHAVPVAQVDLPQGQRANDDRRGLAARVAP
jgi:hypothetical protein